VQNANLAFAFRIFGRPPRTSACDCQRALDPALPQTLYRMTDPLLLGKLHKGLLQQLLASTKTDDQILEELFLATLTRFPSVAEKRHFAAYLEKRKQGLKTIADATIVNVKDGPGPFTEVGNKGTGQTDQTARRAAFADALWALINTREFILNH